MTDSKSDIYFNKKYSRPESMKKVIDILGDYNPSESKVKRTLGMNEEELKAFQQQLLENSFKSCRERISINKRDTQKALDILGIDYSKQKLMSLLGCDEEAFQYLDQPNEATKIKITQRTVV
ncbi:hypothetical protein PPL_09517 [Heterostelium album PN500]|uniref:Uncharacterized protein n=1 Tax=Heterostelium pallidum (strain ATCC 26659 / Pp 5 / PN500) TaxID=670386 RepID=D3BNA6_HETP5|nr:hypothetical protein PPL_09517 [Heterostelium album PN500]EFA76766.1 hypothetical protein PPL_09517 [Heterostelium album PN500]|eukprot:XP_020428898.1 hypothetical protein PPL_09517 [Heterostelium album PN500]